jgi:hypothetical protein
VGNELLGLIEEGHALLLKADFQSAERCFNRAIALDSACSMAHNNLGWTHERSGRLPEAVCSYRQALQVDPALTLARVNLASVLARTGRQREALLLWESLIEERLFDRELLNEAIDAALAIGATPHAAKWADICGVMTRGRPHHPGGAQSVAVNRDLTPAMLRIETLTHDIDQIDYLRRSKVVDFDLDDMDRNYRHVRASLEASGDRRRRPLNDEEQSLIGATYGRIWHVRRTPAAGALPLWGEWDPSAIEESYRSSPLGLCVIDNFLADEALSEVRRFCLQSTVWLANHYSHGRLGAFFREGFNCPLLLELAGQFSQRLPHLIGDSHPLLQLWGFKYSPYQPTTHAHADFAAVNLNFWITPDEANLQPASGGLIVYDVEAPSNWEHNDYNRSGRQISAFLRSAGGRGVYIPYRANRAVLFNSDLFHATAPLSFRSEYENRRINVTMLFGRRAEDPKGPLRKR